MNTHPLPPLLVTGAAGLSGSITVRAFVQHGTPVRALVRDLGKVATGHPLVHYVQGDMLRPESALEGVERVLLISSSVPSMVETQCTFIDACKKAGVRHVIKFSGAE